MAFAFSFIFAVRLRILFKVSWNFVWTLCHDRCAVVAIDIRLYQKMGTIFKGRSSSPRLLRLRKCIEDDQNMMMSTKMSINSSPTRGFFLKTSPYSCNISKSCPNACSNSIVFGNRVSVLCAACRSQIKALMGPRAEANTNQQAHETPHNCGWCQTGRYGCCQ